MIRPKTSILSDIVISIIVALITCVWVYLIGDSPANIALSVIIGVCCGTTAFFLLNKTDRNLKISKHNFPTKQLLIAVFILFVLSYLSPPIDSIFVVDWFSLPLLNVLRFVLSVVFAMFVPGFILLNLIDVHKKLELPANVVLAAILSMLFTATFWFGTRIFSLTSSVSFGLFAFAQSILLVLYLVKNRNGTGQAIEFSLFRLNVVLPLAAIIGIFVSLIFLQEFVYEPFLRGDSWDYVGTALGINKGAFNVAPAGKFYSLAAPNFFETFLASLNGLSGFPPVNSLLVLSVIMAILVPLAFYFMSVRYSRNTTVGLLSTFLFVVASGFGWIPFVFEKLSVGISHSPVNLAGAVELNAPEVLFDIAQPHGVFSEGLKTYAFGVLAIIMLIYLFGAILSPKVRVFLIAMLTAFTFQFHVEEAIIFSLAIVPVFLLLSRGEKASLRHCLIGVIFGLSIAGLINVAYYSQITNVIIVCLLTILALGFFYAFSFIKVDNLQKAVSHGLTKYRLLIFAVLCYFFVFGVYVLLSFGYPNMSDDYSMAIVFQGVSFPWYYYPMSLGVVGILLLLGLLLDYPRDRNILIFWLMIASLMVFGVLLSFFNEYVFSSGAREWRIVYRIIPLPAAIAGGWVIFNLLELRKKKFAIGRRMPKLPFNARMLSVITLLVIIVLGIPSTILASEYWMASGLNPRGNIHPQPEDVELANFFMKAPFSSRAAVLSGGPNALARLAGITTAMPEIYPNITDLSRPETIAVLSSDVRYIVLEKTSSLNYPILRYLSVAFENSKYVVYWLPYLQAPASESTIGYVAPLSYDHPSYASYLLLSAASVNYEIVSDDFYNKTTLILPPNVIGSEVSDAALQVKDWVNEGGHLVVLGGNRFLFEEFGLDGDDRNSLVADSISLGSVSYRLNGTVTVNPWSPENSIDVLGYYQFEDLNVCPFAVQKQVGRGSVLYLNLEPLYDAFNQSSDCNLFNEDLTSLVKASLASVGLAVLPLNSESVPVSDRWLAHYTSYAENDFSAYGDVTVQSVVLGSYLVPNSIKALRLVLNQDGTEEYSNLVIRNISVEGKANLDITSESIISTHESSIPTYFSFQLEDCLVNISSIDGVVNIQTDKGTFQTRNMALVLPNASLIVRNPSISVAGVTHFRMVSLPTTGSPWSENVDLWGETKFVVGYGDSDYVFFDEFSSPHWEPASPKVPIIPLQDLLLSPFNIVFLILLGAILVVSTKRRVKQVDKCN